jgi:hypothetical protein
MQQGLKQQQQLGFAVILLQLLLFFLLNPGMYFRASSLLSPKMMAMTMLMSRK